MSKKRRRGCGNPVGKCKQCRATIYEKDLGMQPGKYGQTTHSCRYCGTQKTFHSLRITYEAK